MTYFLRWLLITGLTCVGTFFTYRAGVFNEVYHKDGSGISFLIFAIFLCMTSWCGFKMWCFQKGQPNVEEYQRLESCGWFISELCLILGMIGTVIGFIMMLNGFSTVDMTNQASIQKLLKDLGFGMSTALYTTLVGLVCGGILKLEYFTLGQAIQQKINSK